MSELSLEVLLKNYRDKRAEYQPDIDMVQEQIEERKKVIAPMLEELATLEKGIKSQALDNMLGGSIDGVSVRIRKGYTRTSWDNKALSGYAVAHPEIDQFRKTSEVKATAIIKVEL